MFRNILFPLATVAIVSQARTLESLGHETTTIATSAVLQAKCCTCGLKENLMKFAGKLILQSGWSLLVVKDGSGLCRVQAPSRVDPCVESVFCLLHFIPGLTSMGRLYIIPSSRTRLSAMPLHKFKGGHHITMGVPKYQYSKGPLGPHSHGISILKVVANTITKANYIVVLFPLDFKYMV